MRVLCLALLLFWGLGSGLTVGWTVDESGFQVAPHPPTSAFIQSQVLPVLTHSCLPCHGAPGARVEGKLRVDSLSGLIRGGRGDGPGVVPFDPDRSAIIRRMRLPKDHDEVMPPVGSYVKHAQVTPAQLADLEQWIRLGAPWPVLSSTAAGAGASSAGIVSSSSSVTSSSISPSEQPVSWLGRGHPALVHLPLGALIVAAFLELLALRRQTLRPAVTATLLLSVVGAIGAIASGLFLEDATGHPQQQLQIHALAGWATLVVSCLALVMSRRTQDPKRGRFLATTLILGAVVVSGIAGHLGGVMVHGPGWPF